MTLFVTGECPDNCEYSLVVPHEPMTSSDKPMLQGTVANMKQGQCMEHHQLLFVSW